MWGSNIVEVAHGRTGASWVVDLVNCPFLPLFAARCIIYKDDPYIYKPCPAHKRACRPDA
jgi:hypothetical protein